MDPSHLTRSYLRAEALAAALSSLAALRPGWMTVETLTLTPEGRPLQVATLTDPRTGPPDSKPAFYLDANIHAKELVGGPVALGLLHRLLSGAESPAFARLLAETTFYVVPRVAVDAVEALLTGRALVRSAVRPWPSDEPVVGLVPRDLDGDGEIRQMRLLDPAGSYVSHPDDPRLMVQRPFDADEGPAWRVLPEGVFEGDDARLFKVAREPFALDFNRNFPSNWRVEREQRGAGPHPLSEPETHALARFVVEHPNICALQALHTGIEVVIPPEGVFPWDKFAAEDKTFFEALGRRGEELLGMPFSSLISLGYGECAGDFGEWAYLHRGIPGVVVELWSLPGRAGVGIKEHLEAAIKRPDLWPGIELRCLQWADAHLGASSFKPWQPYEHPQLGRVEIGGWPRGIWSAPPEGEILEGLVEKGIDFALAHARAVPRVGVVEAGARRLGEGAWLVEAVVENRGHLPTYLTRPGRDSGLAATVKAELHLDAGLEVELGDRRLDLGQLAGRGGRALARWVVRGREGGAVRVDIEAQKGGRSSRRVLLG